MLSFILSPISSSYSSLLQDRAAARLAEYNATKYKADVSELLVEKLTVEARGKLEEALEAKSKLQALDMPDVYVAPSMALVQEGESKARHDINKIAAYVDKAVERHCSEPHE